MPTDKNYLAQVSKKNVIILTVRDESGILYWFPIYSDIDIIIYKSNITVAIYYLRLEFSQVNS